MRQDQNVVEVGKIEPDTIFMQNAMKTSRNEFNKRHLSVPLHIEYLKEPLTSENFFLTETYQQIAQPTKFELDQMIEFSDRQFPKTQTV